MEELNRCCRCGSYMVSRDYSSSAIKYNCLQCGTTFEKREMANKQPISHIDQLIELNNKLLKYEAIESELGISLEVLFKAMEGCFYKVGDEITDGRMDYFYKSVGGEWMAKFIPNGWILGTLDRNQVRHYLKDYGKHWSLDDKDLEV